MPLSFESLGRFLAIATAVVALTSCSLDKLGSESEKWRATAEDVVDKAAKAVDTLAVAVPGERYARLVDDLNNGNPADKKRAQDFFRSLAGIDVGQAYEVTVWFDFDASKALHADIFREALPIDDYVKAQVTSRSLNLADVSSTLLRPPTQGELDAMFDARIDSFINAMRGQNSHTTGGDRFPVWSQNWPNPPLFPNYSLSGLTGNEQQFMANADALNASTRTAIRQTLKSVFQTVYTSVQLPLAAPTLSKGWSLVDPKQQLFVVIPEEDWQAHGAAVTVKAVVHVANDVAQTFDKSRVFTFRKEDFAPVDVVDGTRTFKLRWASHDMTGSSIFADPQTRVRIEELRRAIAEYDEVRTTSPTAAPSLKKKKGKG